MFPNDDDDDLDVSVRPKAGSSSKFQISPEAQVLPTLASQCSCELAVKDNGLAMVIYDKPLDEDIHWIEYDIDLSMLTFVTWSGKVMGLGMVVHKPFRKYLRACKEVMMICMEGDKVGFTSIYPAQLVVRHIGI